MKRFIIITATLLLFISMQAQVGGTAQTLATKKLNLGIIPTLYYNEGTQAKLLNLQMGYGLTSGVDLGVRIGVFENENYFGADLEFAAGKNFSLAGGFHTFSDNLGLDFTGLASFSLGRSARFTTGLDMDIIFTSGDNIAPVWVPLNVEVDIKRNLTFMLEADIDTKLLDESYHIISGGLLFYF